MREPLNHAILTVVKLSTATGNAMQIQDYLYIATGQCYANAKSCTIYKYQANVSINRYF